LPARILDKAVWARVNVVLTNPEATASELDQLRKEDPTTEDFEVVKCAIADGDRQVENLTANLALFTNPQAAAPVVARLDQLQQHRTALIDEREAVLARRISWEDAQTRLDDLTAWCQQIASLLGDFYYEQKRLAIEALGIKEKVWRSDHTLRYVITVDISLDAGVSA
jgi:hypothetical protein